MQRDLPKSPWRKSSYSGGESQCLEVADGCEGAIPVRDSKAPEGARLIFGADAWSSFVAAVKSEGLRSR